MFYVEDDDPPGAEVVDTASTPPAGAVAPAPHPAAEPGAAAEPDAPVPAPRAGAEPDVPSPRASSAGARARGRLPWILFAGAAAAAIVLAVLLVSTRSSLQDHEAADSARAGALAAARSYAVDLAAYDYRSLDQDFATVVGHSTPAFAKTYRQSSAALKTVLTKYHATASASVVAAGLVSGSTSHAVALVFLNQTVTNTSQKSGPTTDQSRLQISLVHSGNAWQIDQVKLL